MPGFQNFSNFLPRSVSIFLSAGVGQRSGSEFNGTTPKKPGMRTM